MSLNKKIDKLVEELVYGLNSYDQRFFNEAGKISPLKQTKTVKQKHVKHKKL